jgi:hypothetical protein
VNVGQDSEILNQNNDASCNVLDVKVLFEHLNEINNTGNFGEAFWIRRSHADVFFKAYRRGNCFNYPNTMTPAQITSTIQGIILEIYDRKLSVHKNYTNFLEEIPDLSKIKFIKNLIV